MPYLFLLFCCLFFSACQSTEERLSDLIEQGDTKALNQLLKDTDNINRYKDRLGRPLAFLALEKQQYEVLELLLKKGANATTLVSDSINLLGFAIQRGDNKAAALICAAENDLYKPCYQQLPPLHSAVKNKQIAIVETLLKAGVAINFPDTLGNTAIFYSTDRATYQILRKATAKTTLRNKAQEDLKSYAQKMGNTALLDILEERNIITFKDCKATKNPRAEISFAQALKQISKRKRMPLGEFPLGLGDYNFEQKHNYSLHYSSDSCQLIAGHYNNFLYALELAYYEHRPIVLSPDMIWLLICQGFSEHINQNPERYRELLVNFSAKKDLELRIDYRPKAGDFWQKVILDFSAAADQQCKDSSLLRIMTPNFSTSTAVEELAFKVTYMDVLKNYFNYILITCGIPSITIEGNPEDWEDILQRVEQLRKYDLDWWIDSLKPCLAQFVRASKGDIDYDFWQSILKNVPILSCDRNERICNGWINHFFPYIYESEPPSNMRIVRNFSKKLAFNRALSGIALVPFKLVDENQHLQENLEFCAGFIGIEQGKDLSLKPKIGFGILSLGK